ncbi:MAG: thioredoxin domain-containing protein [Deltaproteobacteria bacterium]|nr:thioredoxin domain-containing protein [Deltaproteobacteria bacterium]
MIASQLLEEESERQGVDVSELHTQAVADASVDDAEIAAFYEENRERLVESSLEELTPRIHEYLEQQKQAEAWSGFVEGLHEQTGVEILLVMPRLAVASEGPSLGPATAPVTIVEFSDFNCPFCQRVGPTLKELRARYPEQVRIVFRHFPLEMHPRARPIAEASVCADEQGAFWAFHDGVFETASPLADPEIRALAGEASIDLAAFDACLASGRAAEVVERDVTEGAAAGVTGTPAFFVNGVRLSGAQPVEAFVRLIDDELAGSSAPPSS